MVLEPEFEVSNLAVSPSEVRPGEPITISVDVRNVGDTDGTYTATLVVEGMEVGNKSVSVADGGKKTVSFSITESSEGTYVVNIENLSGSFAVDAQPTVSVSADTTSGEEPLTVDFTGTATDARGSIVSYQWNFSDGGTSNNQNPLHTFNNVGLYDVTLTVTDDEGSTASDIITIAVGEWVHIKTVRGKTFDFDRFWFDSQGHRFKMIYDMKSDTYYGEFSAYVYPEGQTIQYIKAIFDKDNGSGRIKGTAVVEKDVYADKPLIPGNYYCDITLFDIAQWSIDIYDWR